MFLDHSPVFEGRFPTEPILARLEGQQALVNHLLLQPPASPTLGLLTYAPLPRFYVGSGEWNQGPQAQAGITS